jgi:flagellar biosynthesis chaperone FliJ
MTKPKPTSWRLDRRINLSVLLQLMVLASMILGSWLNLQRQIDALQHDVTTLLTNEKESQQKLERLSERSLSHEYRLQIIEKDPKG